MTVASTGAATSASSASLDRRYWLRGSAAKLDLLLRATSRRSRRRLSETRGNGMSIETDISEKTIESVRGILESHVAGGYASGVVALIGHRG
jgi:hypothetical protein